MSVLRSVVCGIGSYLPEKTLTNADLARIVDTTDEWIVARSGISERHIVADGELTSDLAVKAARRALRNADMQPSEIDLIVLATATPDRTFPATATQVQAALEIHHGAAFDVQAVCSGFIYATAIADNFLKAGQFGSALVIGAESFSKILDWEDRTTCVLFGDGGGAMVLRAQQASGTAADRGILTTHLHSDGRYGDLLYVDGGPSSTGTTGHVRMNGKEVFRHAVKNMADVVGEALEANGLTASDIHWVVPHQANKRIIDATAKKLKIPGERVIQTVGLHGNTSAASVPLALDCAQQDGRIRKGDLVLMEAMGGGFTWGAALARW